MELMPRRKKVPEASDPAGRRGVGIVPAHPSSSSRDGRSRGLMTCSLENTASVKKADKKAKADQIWERIEEEVKDWLWDEKGRESMEEDEDKEEEEKARWEMAQIKDRKKDRETKGTQTEMGRIRISRGIQVEMGKDRDGMEMEIGEREDKGVQVEMGEDRDGMEVEKEVGGEQEDRRVGGENGGSDSERLARLEKEVGRVLELVTSLAESMALMGERPAFPRGEVNEAPPYPSPSAVCGVLKGSRPAGGGGGGAGKGRKRGGEEEPPNPSQRKRGVGPGGGIPPASADGALHGRRSVRPLSPAVHPPVTRGHPAGGGPPRNMGVVPPHTPPRAAAIIIKGQTGGLSYAEVLRKAKEEIPLEEIGLTDASTRRTVTGDLLVEVVGPDSEGGANKMAKKLSSLFPGATVRRVRSFGEVRLVGFDESTLPEDLVREVVRKGTCGPESVRIGALRFNRGVGSAWAKLPLATATALASGSPLKMGWSTVRVVMLSRRPLQCYRCWGRGHVAATCPSTDRDLSRTCFRCGMEGHPSAQCTARLPFCAACDGAGLFARHRMGGPACRTAHATGEGRGGRLSRRRGRPPEIGRRGGGLLYWAPPPSDNPPL